MAKVALFKFEGFFYVIPYEYVISDSVDLISKGNEYVLTKDIIEETRLANLEYNLYFTNNENLLKEEDIIKCLRECWILAHDVKQIICSNNPELGLRTISDEIMKEYDDNWDNSFMFPEMTGYINNVVTLVVTEDSSY